jgi:hypothetical protein
MSYLHRENTMSVTQDYSRRYENATLQREAHATASLGWAPKGWERPPHLLSQ